MNLNLFVFAVRPSVYFSAFQRLEEGEGLQEDPEDPDYEGGQEEEFAEGKFHYSLVILILCL